MLKRGGGSSNVHVVLKGGHQNVHVCSQGGGGVKIVPNPVHVVCERPLDENFCRIASKFAILFLEVFFFHFSFLVYLFVPKKP